MHVAALRAVRGSGGSRVGLPRISSSSSFLLLPPALALLFWPSRPPRRGAPRHSHKARASPCDVPDVEPPSAAPWIATTAAARWFVVWILHMKGPKKQEREAPLRTCRASAREPVHFCIVDNAELRRGARARASARAADRFCIAQNTKARRVTHTRAFFYVCISHGFSKTKTSPLFL